MIENRFQNIMAISKENENIDLSVIADERIGTPYT